MLIHFLQTDEPKKQKIFIEDVFKTDKKNSSNKIFFHCKIVNCTEKVDNFQRFLKRFILGNIFLSTAVTSIL